MKAVLFGVAAVFVALLPSLLRAENLLANPGFETPESTFSGEFFPSVPGDWDGDASEIIATENGITPRSGSQMLHFIYSAAVPSLSNVGSEVMQLVDMTPHASDVAAGQVVATASAWFNRIAGDAQTDTRFLIRLIAFDGLPEDFPTRWPANDYLARTEVSLYTDADPETWEELAGELLLPCGTTYVAMWVVAVEDVFNDGGGGVEFDGHYADDAALEIATGQCRTAGRSVLVLRNKADDEKDRLIFRWSRGESTEKEEFGDPSVDANYTLCISHAGGAFARFGLSAGAGWEDKEARGYTYRDATGSQAGLIRGLLKPSSTGRTRVLFKGRGSALELPDLGTLEPPVKVGVQRSGGGGVCWGAEFDNPRVDTGELWKGRAP